MVKSREQHFRRFRYARFRDIHLVTRQRQYGASLIRQLYIRYSVCSMPVLRSQTVYLSITVFLSLALSQQHTLLLSHVPCFVSASRCSCSLMCLALSQHHAALALSCALLCLSITLLLLSHVPCFVSASRCSCSLMSFALSQHHAALAFSCA